MDAQKLQDILAKGWGAVGRKLGSSYTVYRPQGINQPTRPQNRKIEISATFSSQSGGRPQGAGYGEAMWWGMFDSLYTAAGDYLVGPVATYFIARQWPGLPIQCVLTNRTVTIVRPAVAQSGSYSGFFASPGELIIAGWPASLLDAGGHSVPLKPSETRLGAWELLLPVLPVDLMVADVVSDDLRTNYVVSSAEQSSLGWRLLVRQIGA